MALFDDDEVESQQSEDDNPAFARVYDKQEALQELLDAGGEAGEPPETSLAKIKDAGRELLDAINDLSLEDLADEFDTEEDAETGAPASMFSQ